MKYVINFYWLICKITRNIWDIIEDKFGIPNTPKALPMRGICTNPNEYCWEDFKKDSKEKYPIRYFIFYILDSRFRVLVRKYIEDPIFYLENRFFKKYHLIDLRGTNILGYKYDYSYTDPQYVLEMAMYKSFKRYFDEFNIREKIDYFENEILEEQLKHKPDEYKIDIDIGQLDFLRKVKEIDDFFEVKLPQMYAEENAVQEMVTESVGDKRLKYEKLKQLEDKRNQAMTETLIEIVKIRESLWH